MSGCVMLAGLPPSPVGASAQRDSQRKSPSLSAAIEEVRRSPFHGRDRVRRSLDGAREHGTDPAVPFLRHVGAHPVAARETGEDTRTAAQPLFFWTMLGVAAGDLLVFLFPAEITVWNIVYLTLGVSVPVTTLSLALAGVSPGWAVAASSLGFAAGLGAGVATLKVLEDPLYYAALVPGALAYYGVRLAVTRLIAGRGVS